MACCFSLYIIIITILFYFPPPHITIWHFCEHHHIWGGVGGEALDFVS